jgi:long-subunit acyl-CoA synthetase (AMP-forming)
MVDAACVLYNLTTIPIYDTLGDENITYVFKHTGLTTCFVNDSGVKALQKTTDLVNIKNLVSFDPISSEQI